jgi:Protein of unknown function (DUF2550)
MLIALLAVLGVDLIAIVVLVGALLGRRRWIKNQPGAFAGVIRIKSEVDGLGSSWKRGYGRWVRDVFVWTKGPLNIRNALLPTDELIGERTVDPEDRPKRLGDRPMVVSVACGDAVVEIASSNEHAARLRGPYLEKEHV